LVEEFDEVGFLGAVEELHGGAGDGGSSGDVVML
jgi:hypothetical protein